MSVLNGQSVESDVLDAVVSALGGSDTNSYLARFKPFAQAELPADEVLPDEADDAFEDTSSCDTTFRFMIRHVAAANHGALKLADARRVRAAKLLFADPLLGGLVMSLHPVRRKWEMDKAEVEIVALVATYEVQFSTPRFDPTRTGI